MNPADDNPRIALDAVLDEERVPLWSPDPASSDLTTHAASGLTRNDFVLATKIDQLTGD